VPGVCSMHHTINSLSCTIDNGLGGCGTNQKRRTHNHATAPPLAHALPITHNHSFDVDALPPASHLVHIGSKMLLSRSSAMGATVPVKIRGKRGMAARDHGEWGMGQWTSRWYVVKSCMFCTKRYSTIDMNNQTTGKPGGYLGLCSWQPRNR